MKAVVGTTAWSLFLGREGQGSPAEVAKLKNDIPEGRAVLPGIVRQELLPGIKNPGQFAKRSHPPEGFSDALATSGDHIAAARFFNQCRKGGIPG